MQGYIYTLHTLYPNTKKLRNRKNECMSLRAKMLSKTFNLLTLLSGGIKLYLQVDKCFKSKVNMRRNDIP